MFLDELKSVGSGCPDMLPGRICRIYHFPDTLDILRLPVKDLKPAELSKVSQTVKPLALAGPDAAPDERQAVDSVATGSIL